MGFTIPLLDFKKELDGTSWQRYYFSWTLISQLFLKYSTTSNNDPSLNYLSAKNILPPCPPSLLKALDPSDPDHQMWLDSYNKEKKCLVSHDIYENILKTQYLALKQAGKIPKATPSTRGFTEI